jgi:DNA-binding Lrp family transcriptional regulator
MLTDLEKKIIASIQGDIPVTECPYDLLAERIGIPVDEFLKVLKGLSDRGLIRRFGATLRHQKSGYTANAMVAWRVEEERTSDVGEKMASFPQVSHCYRRNPAQGWPYNLYTMVHATSEDDCLDTARKISEAVGVTDYAILFSRKELKKTSMKYFSTAS